MSNIAKLNFLLLGIIVSIILIIGGITYYKSEKNLVITQKYNELKFIANEKANRILQWRDERIDNTKNISYSPFFVDAVAKWIANKNDLTLGGKIVKRLSLIKENNEYENVILVSNNGNILISLDKRVSRLDSVTASLLNRVISNKETILTDLYKSAGNNKIYMNVIAPIVNDKGAAIALLISIINPDDYLYPLIQSWPTLSKTAETLIIRKDSGNIVFLNKLRHKKVSPLSFKLPIIRYDLPAVKAITYEGNFEGKDYRGKDVLADLRHIDGTNWYMVTKVDADEILSELGYRTDVIIFVVIILIILSFFGAAFVYRSRQRNYYRELFNKERDLYTVKEEFKTALYSIGDGIITVTTAGTVKAMNHVAEELTGWKENEAAGKPIEQVFKIINENSKRTVENPVKKVLKEGTIVGLANHTLLISKDGRSIPIADSGAPIKSENGTVSGVVLAFRDQTEERLSQKAIEESRQRFLSLFTKMSEGVALHELLIGKNNNPENYRIIDVNPQFEKILGINRLDAIGKLATEIYNTSKAPYLEEYSNVALSGKSFTFETYFPVMDKYFNISVTPWLRKGFATIFSDITEKKRSEEALNRRLFALTQPLENTEDIKFSDLFNINDLQLLQDAFAEATGVGSLITDPDGVPLTTPSNFCRLCNDIIRKTEKGAANCKRSDSFIGCYNPDGPTVKACLSGGLWDAGASIKIGGRHIANWLVGQVRNEATDEDKIMQYADTINADRAEFKKALDEVTIMSKDKFNKVADALYLFANELSLKAYQNIQQARFITEREKIEEEIRLREENLSITLNSIGDAVISTDTNGIITRMNPVAGILTGWDINEAIGQPLPKIFRIINAESRNEVTNPVVRVIKEKLTVGLANHTILIAKDGTERQIADSAAPIKDKEGIVCGVVLVFSDVTKEYETYKALEDSARFLKDSQLAGRIGSYMMDIKANIWICSEIMDNILGIDGSFEKSTEGWLSLVHPDWQEMMGDYFINEVIGKKQRFDKDYMIKRKSDGAERWVHGAGELEFDENGQADRMLGTIQDITERVKAQQELEMYKNHLEDLIKVRTADLDNANKRLINEIQKEKEYELMLKTSLAKEQELNELKTRFISTTSHEFRTPLTSVLSSAELIKRYGTRWSQNKIDEHLDRIKNSVDHLTKLLDDVLTISRADNGRINYNPQLIDLKSLCEEIITEAKSHSNDRHNFIFNYSIEKQNFMLDPKLIRFILVNLLSNAFKYSPDGGNVILEIIEDECNLFFTVEDSGIGIPDEDRRHLFDPFHRGNNVNEIAGTGLGLSIVNKSVEIHSGKIVYKSLVGQGTTFTVTIPKGEL